MKGKIGCFFIYSIIMILLGMGLYKYRAEILNYVSQKYHEVITKASDKASEVKNDVKE